MALGALKGYVRWPGVDRSSCHSITQCLCHHILEEGLPPTDALLISSYTGWGTMEEDPLSATIGARGSG